MVHVHTFVQRTSFIKRTYNSINYIHITVHPHPTALAYTESEKFIKAPTQYRHVYMYVCTHMQIYGIKMKALQKMDEIAYLNVRIAVKGKAYKDFECVCTIVNYTVESHNQTHIRVHTYVLGMSEWANGCVDD